MNTLSQRLVVLQRATVRGVALEVLLVVFLNFVESLPFLHRLPHPSSNPILNVQTREWYQSPHLTLKKKASKHIPQNVQLFPVNHSNCPNCFATFSVFSFFACTCVCFLSFSLPLFLSLSLSLSVLKGLYWLYLSKYKREKKVFAKKKTIILKSVQIIGKVQLYQSQWRKAHTQLLLSIIPAIPCGNKKL